MWAHPGKKLLFMGSELAQEAEWSYERSLDWHLLENPDHAGIQALVRDLNRIYREEPALWEIDSDPSGFWWLEPNDADANVLAFARASKPDRNGDRRMIVFAANLSPVPRSGYRLGLPRACRWKEALNTDSTFYGGSDVGNMGGLDPEPIPWHNQPVSALVTLPPLAAVWFIPEAQ
jgi:1,4-alpha-glucan branching enzyme